MLAETLGAVIFIGLSLALYRLFEDVDRHRARQLVALVLVSSALGLVTVVFSAAALLVFRGGDAFAGFDGATFTTAPGEKPNTYITSGTMPNWRNPFSRSHLVMMI